MKESTNNPIFDVIPVSTYYSILDIKTREILMYIAEHREELVKAFLAEHGCMPSDAVLFTQTKYNENGYITKCWIEKIPSSGRG